MTTKNGYREQGKNILQNISQSDKLNIENKLRHQLFQTTEWEKAKTVGVTISKTPEWDTQSLIHHAWETGKRVVVPKSHPSDKTMTFYILNSFDDLDVANYNLLEPKSEPESSVSKTQIDLLIVPGLMFDKKGFRIGFGGGYFDRFLKDFKGSTLSLLSSKQLVDTLPTDAFDKPVDILVTEEECLRTGGA